jgi:hypothetical protein
MNARLMAYEDASHPTHDDEAVVDGAPVRFQEVVHSNQTEEAECASNQILLGRNEWTFTRMPD